MIAHFADLNGLLFECGQHPPVHPDLFGGWLLNPYRKRGHNAVIQDSVDFFANTQR